MYLCNRLLDALNVNVCVCVCVCVCFPQARVDEIPGKALAMEDLNQRLKQNQVPVEKHKDIRVINSRFTQVRTAAPLDGRLQYF